MEEYARVLSYAIPFFFFLITIESILLWKYKKISFRAFDTIASLSSGVTNTMKQVMGLSVVIISYEWLYHHFAIIHLSSPWYLYVIGFIGIDFAGYWSHRFEHVINIFWNRHIIHHSSEEFNLACALRQTISGIIAIFTILLLPCAIFGIPPQVIGIIAPLHLFAQFWYHTKLIDRMGWLEHIIVTPSHHRVHHAINPEYIDKNYGQIFIIWDKFFGTFQEEKREVVPVFGVKKAVSTWNPFKINFMHMWNILKDAWHATSWLDKCRIWFMPTGWRPDDVKERYPQNTIEDVYHFQKYETKASLLKMAWVWIYFIVVMALSIYLLLVIAQHPYGHIIVYGIFIMVSIYGLTALMDGDKTAIVAEGINILPISYMLYHANSWFGVSGYLIIAFWLSSFLASIYFLFFEQNSTVSLANE